MTTNDADDRPPTASSTRHSPSWPAMRCKPKPSHSAQHPAAQAGVPIFVRTKPPVSTNGPAREECAADKPSISPTVPKDQSNCGPCTPAKPVRSLSPRAKSQPTPADAPITKWTHGATTAHASDSPTS